MAPTATSSRPFVFAHDRQRLGADLTWAWAHGAAPRATLAPIEEKLETSQSTGSPDAARCVVTMNARVHLRDLATNVRRAFTLRYPNSYEDPDTEVSVLSSLGVAVLGCQAGDTIEVADRLGVKNYEVERVFQ